MHIGSPAALDTRLVPSGHARTRQPSRTGRHRTTTGRPLCSGTDIAGCPALAATAVCRRCCNTLLSAC